MKTFSIKPADVQKKWFVVDAEELILGRASVVIANYLRGKHKPEYTPHIDCGDNIVVINAEKIAVTGKKLDDKIHHWHTGHPGGIKQRTLRERLEGQHPQRVIKKSVERMMPTGPLAYAQLKNLYVYAGAEHPHVAQKPEALDIASMNSKNKRRS